MPCIQKIENKIKNLNFIDIAVLAVIFFGTSVYSSFSGYFALQEQNLAVPANLSVNDLADWQTTVMQVVLLAAAWLYLHWRKFDFRVLNFKIDRYTLPLTLLLFFGAGLFADMFSFIQAFLLPEAQPETLQDYFQNVRYTPELILTSLTNGFFEELFFTGLVFAARPKILPQVVLFSLPVRFAFHTYQGLSGALHITTLGLSFGLFRRKISVLVPFFLAHALFDIFGLSFIGLFY